jgi:hypothetical protein
LDEKAVRFQMIRGTVLVGEAVSTLAKKNRELNADQQ